MTVLDSNPEHSGIERVLHDFDEANNIAARIRANKQRRNETHHRAKVAMGIINAVRNPNGPTLDDSADAKYSGLIVMGRNIRDGRHVLLVASLETQWYDTPGGGLVKELNLIPGTAVLVTPQQIATLETDRFAKARFNITIGG